ncbi:2,3-butanediol dehydrogenase [Lachancea thermotolerans CBS 6340]|uniref:KLTH0D00616p n=1 Tax=Lachancea thermotolerans (strain ATCC 56472 / CBS 6340 / NRRL Y-8284) TaxID=559295 RepID=C5DFX0_LACTC|nr:KLTH0D00616p [Lachancea thermotolerans CBS 6340]CAR22312.1 KLTH0D00616p [Lachancea thermotolerans CBS 6340]
MRALAYFGQKDIRFTDSLAQPQVSHEDEVEIDVSWCGVCGSDLHEYLDGPIFFPANGKTHAMSGQGLPQAMGHEMSGIVSKVGSDVSKVKVGDHVVVGACCTCEDRARWPDVKHEREGLCIACKTGNPNCCTDLGFCGLGCQSGGFAEKIVLSERNVVKIPNSLPLDVAALVEPISVSWHAVRISKLQPGQTALVLGAGPIGLAAVLALQSHGAGTIIVSEPADTRRQKAEALGAQTFNPTEHGDNVIEALRKLAPGGEGFNFSYDCCGTSETFSAGLHTLTPKGVAVNIAVWGPKPIDFYPMDVTTSERFVTGSICYTTQDFEEVVDAMDKGKIDINKVKTMITGRERIENGFENGIMDLINNKEKNIKILLTPNNFKELA